MSTRKACIVCSQEFAGDDTVCPNDGTILTPLMQDRYVGTVLAGRYEVMEVIGGGGMGLVYKARHTMMNRIVAIKMLHSHLTTSPDTLKRFQLEAQAASCLSLPNILTIYDFGVTDEGQPYMVMDYLEGTSLADILEADGHLPVSRSLGIFVQACAGLAHAHQKGVIHRDLKPSNIMLVNYGDQTDFVKIVDFGIAKLLNRVDGSGANLTRTGEVYGSPLYMSPEQCRGHELDARSDLYSFGCVMYKTLTGSPIFQGTEMIELLFKQVSEHPLPFAEICPDAEVPEELERIVFKSLAKDPNDRFQSMTDLKDVLEEFKQKFEGAKAIATAAAAAASSPAPPMRSGTANSPVPAGPLAAAMAARSHTAEHSNAAAPPRPPAASEPSKVAAAAASGTAIEPVRSHGSEPTDGNGKASAIQPHLPSDSSSADRKSSGGHPEPATTSVPPSPGTPSVVAHIDKLREKDTPDWLVLVESLFANKMVVAAVLMVILLGCIVGAIVYTRSQQAPAVVSTEAKNMQLLAEASLNMNNPGEAVDDYKKAIDAQKKASGQDDGPECAPLWSGLGRAYLLNNDTKNGEPALTKAIEIYQRTNQPSTDFAQALEDRGHAYLNQGSLASAKDDLKQAIDVGTQVGRDDQNAQKLLAQVDEKIAKTEHPATATAAAKPPTATTEAHPGSGQMLPPQVKPQESATTTATTTTASTASSPKKPPQVKPPHTPAQPTVVHKPVHHAFSSASSTSASTPDTVEVDVRTRHRHAYSSYR